MALLKSRQGAHSLLGCFLPSLSQAGKLPEVVVANGGHVRHPKGGWRGAGVAVPTFSLRSRQSVGCGEFLDLIPLVDIAASAGLRVVQILPVNDTRVHGMWWDSYPYSSVSVFALHPMYLRLQALLDPRLPADISADIERARAKLDLKDVDYEATVAAKVSIARRVFDLRKREVFADDSFQAFVDGNAAWLKPYAAFMILKDLFGSADHTQWGLLSQPSAEVIDKLTRPESDCADAAQFVFFLQWHLHKQLLQASQHAKARHVVLKGDLPIGVDKRSVDTWLHPRLFRMNTSTGAPPDSFDPNGQNWGFPTYNWEEMARDEYSWWCARLRQMSQYFSAYRIDHVLGMFRIWELPAHAVGGILGRFRPALPITKHEFESRGLWDVMRLEEPYVRNAHLQDSFGQRAMDVALRFLIETSPGSGRWRFREEFATERGIVEAECLAPRAGSPQWLLDELAATKAALLSLVRNVVVIADPEQPGGYHPRFHLEHTSSFAELEGWQQDALRHLHSDYYARQDSLWRRHALRTLPVLQHATGMLVCGEDLGLVPPCVHEVMLELGVVGLRIQRMPPNDGQFDRPGTYPYLTVCSPSCHDTTTTRAWWEQDHGRQQAYIKEFLAPKPPPQPTLLLGPGGGPPQPTWGRGQPPGAGAGPGAGEGAAATTAGGSGEAAEAAAGAAAASHKGDGDAAAGAGGDAAAAAHQRSPSGEAMDTQGGAAASAAPGGDEEEAPAPEAEEEEEAEPAGPPPEPEKCTPEIIRGIIKLVRFPIVLFSSLTCSSHLLISSSPCHQPSPVLTRGHALSAPHSPPQHLESPSCLAIFPIQDILALDQAYIDSRPALEETINEPTNARHYWRFRLGPYLEDLAANAEWTGALRALVEESGRLGEVPPPQAAAPAAAAAAGGGRAAAP